MINRLKFFTFLSLEEIAELEKAHTEKPEARTAHKALAKAVTDMIHGEQATNEAIRASEILFGGGLEGIPEATFQDIIGEVPSKDIAIDKITGQGMPLVELLAESGLSNSKGQARKDIEGGGIYLNNQREGNIQRLVTAADLLFGKYLLLRKGKRNYTAVQVK